MLIRRLDKNKMRPIMILTFTIHVARPVKEHVDFMNGYKRLKEHMYIM